MKNIQTSLNNSEYELFKKCAELLHAVGLINKPTDYAALKFMAKYSVQRIPMDLEAIASSNMSNLNRGVNKNEITR